MIAVQHPQHRILAEQIRHDRDAQIDFTAFCQHFETAILRNPAFRNVEFGNHLDARQDLIRQIAAIQALDHAQNAVQTIFDVQALRLGFEVDIAGAGTQCVIDRRIDQTHDSALGAADVFNRDRQRAVVDRVDGVCNAYRIHRPDRFLDDGQIGAYISGSGDAPTHGLLGTRAQTRVDPGAGPHIQRICRHQQQIACRFDERDAQPLAGLDKRQQFKIRLEFPHHDHRHRPHPEVGCGRQKISGGIIAEARRYLFDRLQGRTGLLLHLADGLCIQSLSGGTENVSVDVVHGSH